MTERQSWEKILEELENGSRAVVVIIVDREGSAPNAPGAKMFVTQNHVSGTVGGGISEHQLLEKAKVMIEAESKETELIHLEHNETAEKDRSGMLCSGSQSFALITLDSNDSPTIKKIVNAFHKAQVGSLIVDKFGLNFNPDSKLSQSKVLAIENEQWNYKENLAEQDKIFIIGGGHVSLALSLIMRTLGFHITIFDDRENLPTLENNNFADEKQIVDYRNIAKYIPEGENIYVTIMTFGHLSDELVLERIINKNCKYIGMMASNKKATTIFSNLVERGISKQLIKTVHSPIGIKIKSHSPEEIAISIAAEIISIKNK